MQTSQANKSTPASQANVAHHTKAAGCCTKAAAEHVHAAKSCASGDRAKAEEHAKRGMSLHVIAGL